MEVISRLEDLKQNRNCVITTGTFDGESWASSISGNKKFYRLTAIRELSDAD